MLEEAPLIRDGIPTLTVPGCASRGNNLWLECKPYGYWRAPSEHISAIGCNACPRPAASRPHSSRPSLCWAAPFVWISSPLEQLAGWLLLRGTARRWSLIAVTTSPREIWFSRLSSPVDWRFIYPSLAVAWEAIRQFHVGYDDI